MKNSLVSVIIPVYNVEDYLDNCLDTVIHQDYKNLEIILVDDGSTDNSGNKVDEWAKKDNRIVPLHQRNQGLSAARNTGLDNSHGAWIIFIDSDDYVSENYVSVLLRTAEKDNSDLVICQYSELDNTKAIPTAFSMPGKYTQKDFWKLFYSPNSGSALVVAWDKLYSAKIFQNLRYKVGILNEDEQILYSVICRTNSISIISQALYFYRIDRGDSIMSKLSKTGKIRVCLYSILLERFKKLVEANFEESAIQCIKDILMRLTGELAINPSKENWHIFWQIFNQVKTAFNESNFDDVNNMKVRVYIACPRLICWLKILRIYLRRAS